jgi:hypothetical protein
MEHGAETFGSGEGGHLIPFTIICYADGRTEPHRPDYAKLDCPLRSYVRDGALHQEKCTGPTCAAWQDEKGCGMKKGRA